MLELLDVRLKPDAATIRHAFPERKLTVVLGGNLAGKTRLARVIAGLEAPDGGELRIGGRPMAGSGPGERPVALVVQQFVNYPNWTVAENLASPLVARGEAAGVIRSRVRDIARQLGLETLLDRYPAALSGGQQQRLAIGRALAKEAEILVMDEPLVNLDFKLREGLQAELRKLQQQLGTTVIYTSTDPRDAFALADEVVLMAGHGFIQSGEPLAVYRKPTSPAAADLLSDPRANRLPGDESVMVRPEHLFLTPGADDDLSFEVRVLAAETNGSETYLHCRPGGTPDDGHWVAHLSGLVELQPGQTVTLHAPRNRLIRFGRASGASNRG